MIHNSISSSSSQTSNKFTTTPLLVTSTQNYSFTIFYDKDNPDATLAHAREIKRQEELEGTHRLTSGKYLNALIAVAIGHFQKKDYAMARRCALYAHDSIADAKGNASTLRYFAAVTVSKCSDALAKELQAVVDERKEMSNFPQSQSSFDDSTSLLSKATSLKGGIVDESGKRFKSIDQLIQFLRNESASYGKSAERILDLPDKYFMRTDAEHREAAARETSQSSHDHDDGSTNGTGDYFTSNSKKYSYDADQRRKRGQENYEFQRKHSEERGKYQADWTATNGAVGGSPARHAWQAKRHRDKPGRFITSVMRNPR